MRRAKVLSHATTSKPGYFVCPACGSGEVLLRGSDLARCDSCGCAFDGAIVGTLKQIVALPEALMEHACEECEHPEMRHCPTECSTASARNRTKKTMTTTSS